MTMTTPNASDDQVLTGHPNVVRYLNHYHCPVCQTEWQDEWDCGCNDRCPRCRREIEPYASLPSPAVGVNGY